MPPHLNPMKTPKLPSLVKKFVIGFSLFGILLVTAVLLIVSFTDFSIAETDKFYFLYQISEFLLVPFILASFTYCGFFSGGLFPETFCKNNSFLVDTLTFITGVLIFALLGLILGFIFHFISKKLKSSS